MAACTHEPCLLPSTQTEVRFYCLTGFLSEVSWDPPPPNPVGTDTIHLVLNGPVTTVKSGEMGPTQIVKLMLK